MCTSPWGLRSRAASSGARPTASNWRGAVVIGRPRVEKHARQKQVLRYRISNPKLGQADAEVQPAAAAAQPVVDSQQQSEIEAAATATDLTYALQQSQERLKMAKALGLDQAMSQHLLVTRWPPAVDTASNTPESSDSEALSEPSTHTGDSIAVTVEPASLPAATGTPSPVHDLEPTVSAPSDLPQVTFTAADFLSSSSSSVQHEAVPEPVSNGTGSSSNGYLGWGIAADALLQANSPAHKTLTPASQVAADVLESTVSKSSTVHPQQPVASEHISDHHIEHAAPEQANIPQQVLLPREQLKVVQLYWAQAPNGKQPQYFYMPDPLAVPCKLEVSRSLELELPYDNQLVDQMWQEVKRVEEDNREFEADTSDESGDESSISSSSHGCSDVEEPETTSSASIEIAQESIPTSTMIEFRFHCQTKPGERLWLVGDHPSLGSWDLQKAVKLKWSEGHVWQAFVEFSPGTRAAYKAVLQLANQQYRWQSGSDFQLNVTGNMQTVQQEFK